MSQDLCDVDELLLSFEEDDSHDRLELESMLEDDDECETDEEDS